MTITGDLLPVSGQHNYLFRIGMPLSFIAEQAGGVPEYAAKIVSGGPMMGKAVANLDASAVKGTASLLYLSKEATKRKEEGHCIRCAKCVSACPMGLEPYLLAKLSEVKNWERAEHEDIVSCIECGSCQFTCPAHRPLLDNIRQGKGTVMGIIRSRAAKK
jgi:electron transport complex protein RnfC